MGQNRQLFIDDHIIESLDGVTKTLNQPVKYADNPVLPMVPEGDPSWEAGMHFCFITILFDEADGLYKMWYSLWGANDQSMILAYATSRNGIHWVKPSLGIVEHRDQFYNMQVMLHDELRIGLMTGFSYGYERPRGSVRLKFHMKNAKLFSFGFRDR